MLSTSVIYVVTKPTSNQQTPLTKPELITQAVQEPLRSNTPSILPDVTEIRHEYTQRTQPEPSPPIDLLNLNQPQPQQPLQDPQATAMPTSDASFDLLGAFGDDHSSGIGSAPIPDILGKKITSFRIANVYLNKMNLLKYIYISCIFVENNVQPTSSADLDDIFGSVDSTTPKISVEFKSFGGTQPPIAGTDTIANASTSRPKVTPTPATGAFFGSVPTFNTNSSKELSPQNVSVLKNY